MAGEMKHTPTPWMIGKNPEYVEIWGPMLMNAYPILAGLEHEPREANAAFIVEAVNYYATLQSEIAALKAENAELRTVMSALLDADEDDDGATERLSAVEDMMSRNGGRS